VCLVHQKEDKLFADKNWWLLVLLLMLSACQHIAPNSENNEWLNDETFFAQRQTDFEAQNKWQYSARVGVTSKSMNEQANIVWLFENELNSVRLFGPLGAGQVKLEFDDYGVQLSDKKGITHQGYASQGDTAERLLSEIAGLPIPLEALSYWMFVLPQPGSIFEYQVNQEGNLSSLKQLGWQINYADYRDYGGNFLPRRLTATRSEWGDNTEEVTVRMVSRDWQW